MVDNWNLKDCKLYAGRGYFRGDIETLYQKLIESVNNKIGETVYKDDVINIINKLFGRD